MSRLKPIPGWRHPEGLQSRRILRAALRSLSSMSTPCKMLRKLIMTNGLIAFVIFLSLAAGAQSRTDCNAINSQILKQSVRYCVQLPADYDADDAKQRHYPVLYFLHGLGQNEQTLFSTGGWSLIEDLRRQHKIIDFLIVAPDGDRVST